MTQLRNVVIFLLLLAGEVYLVSLAVNSYNHREWGGKDTQMATPLELLREMKHFVNEYQFMAGPRQLQNLPNPEQFYAGRTVVMPKDLVVRFRNDYLLLLGFAAHYCQVDPENLCQLDLLGPFIRALQNDDAGDTGKDSQ